MMDTYVAERVLMAASDRRSYSKCKFQLRNKQSKNMKEIC